MKSNHFPMPALTDSQRKELIESLQDVILVETHSVYGCAARIALAALTAPHVGTVIDVGAARLVEWERSIQEDEKLYTVSPVPLKSPVVVPYLPADCDRTEAHFKYQAAIRAAGYEVQS